MSTKVRPGESFLSPDAHAILRYARSRSPEPFTRQEIVDIAPGAEWDMTARWPRTVADVDPIRELVRAGLIVQHGEQPAKTGRRGQTFKWWRLAEVDPPRTLAELLDDLINKVSRDEWGDSATVPGVESVRDEILRRFGDR